MDYIYVLIDPRDNEVRYVGKTNDPHKRLRRHRTEKGETPRHIWLRELHELAISPAMMVLAEVPHQEWATCERKWIAALSASGFPLMNKASGGNGAPGISPSQETREKLRAKLKQDWQEHPRHISEEHRAALTAGRKAYGCPPEHRARISAANRGRKMPPESIARMAATKRGRSHGPLCSEGRDKISAALSGEGNGQAKLTWAIVDDIRKSHAQGAPCSALARLYGVSYGTIYRAVRKEQWVRRPDNNK